MYDFTMPREDSNFFENLTAIPSETACRITDPSLSPSDVMALARANDSFQDLVASNKDAFIRGVFDTKNAELSLRDALWAYEASTLSHPGDSDDTAELHQDIAMSEAELDEDLGMYEILDLPDLNRRKTRKAAEQESKELLYNAKTLLGQIDTFEYPKSLNAAHDIDEFHNDFIRPLVVWFVQFTRKVNGKLDKSLEKTPVSRLEFHRVARAFYRLELLAQTWIRVQNETHEQIALVCEAFCRQFAPWEMTQICCVHDFLAWNVAAGKFADTTMRLA